MTDHSRPWVIAQSTRPAASTAKFGASAETSCEAVRQDRLIISVRRRGQCAVQRTSGTVVKAATRTRLTLSASKTTHGHEGSERLTVTVAPRYAGTASGTVTVTAGTTSACAIKLSKGRGSCALSASRLNPGTYHLIAHWPGNADFTPSTSTPTTLTVLR